MNSKTYAKLVALYARAWVEIGVELGDVYYWGVALYARAWVEIRLNTE